MTTRDLLEAAARALPPKTADAVAESVAFLTCPVDESSKVGVCAHPEDREEEP